MAPRLGVDFGTSHTVAVLGHDDRAPQPLLFDGSPLLASAVYLEPDGTVLVGRDALHSARLRPERFEPNPKRRVDDGTVLLADTEIPVVELFAAVLGRVRAEAERVAGTGDLDTVVTHPAVWGAARRLLLTDACAAAGLTRVTAIPEPVAAARYFAHRHGVALAPGNVVVVYDFGGGTFDASVVAATGTGFEVLAVDGLDSLGGVDIDHAIVEHLGARFGTDERWSALLAPGDASTRRQHRAFLDDVRGAKERLSRQSRVELLVPLLETDTHLTRGELETICAPMLAKAVRLTEAVIRVAAVPPERIAGVFLVGGASRMPLAATSLHRGVGIAPTVIDQPELVVATGAITTPTGTDSSPAAQSSAAPTPAAPQPNPAAGPESANPAAGPLVVPSQPNPASPPVTGAAVPVVPGHLAARPGSDTADSAVPAAAASPPPTSLRVPPQSNASPSAAPTSGPTPVTVAPGQPSAPIRPGRSLARPLKVLLWAQFAFLTGLGLFAIVMVSVDPPPTAFIWTGAIVLGLSPFGLAIPTAANALRLDRDPVRVRRSTIITQSLSLAHAGAGACFIVLVGMPGPPMVRALLAVMLLIAGLTLGLALLHDPASPTPGWRGPKPLRSTLIVQCALMVPVALVVIAWWLTLAGYTDPGIGAERWLGFPVITIAMSLILLGTIGMLLAGLPRPGTVEIPGRARTVRAQWLWLGLVAVYTTGWFDTEENRLLPTIADDAVTDLGYPGPWDYGGELTVLNDLALWLTVASAIPAILAIVQYLRMPGFGTRPGK